MKEPFNYNGFVTRVNEEKLNYLLLIYSNAMLIKHLKNPKLRPCLILENNFNLAVNENEIQDALYLDSDIILKQITNYGEFRKDNFNVTCDNLLMSNSHFLRTKILNVVFETISHYFAKSEHWKQLHTLNWFQILYLLRNNASHFDNYNRKICFPTWKWLVNPYPPNVEWNNIKISNGQFGHDIKYNDRQVLELMDYIVKYFDENERIYSLD